jgi:hypothetical protein
MEVTILEDPLGIPPLPQISTAAFYSVTIGMTIRASDIHASMLFTLGRL